MTPRPAGPLPLAIALLAAGAASAQDGWPTAAWPAWAKARDVTTVTGEPGFAAHERELNRNGAFHRIIYDTWVRVDADGRDRVLDREVIAAHGQQGLDLAGDLDVTYAPSDEDLFLVHLRRRAPGGEWQDVPYGARLFAEGRVEGMYVDERTVSFIPEGVGPGDQVDFAYLLVARAPESPWDWIETDDYGSHVCARRLVIDAPRPLGLRFHASGFDPPLASGSGDRLVIELSVRHADPPAIEEQMPDGYDPRRTLLVSNAPSFASLGASYRAILDSTPLDDRVKALAASIAGRGGDPVAALAAFVQEHIRYVGLEVKSHRARPSPPPEVLERGYGDCKDMALLLVHLLRGAGLEAWSALVRTPDLGPVDPALPVLSAFNHEIAAVRRGGALVFIDPTVKEAVPPWSGAIREGAAVLVADGVHGLVTAARQPDGVSAVESRVMAALGRSRGGARRLDLDVTTSYSGPALADMRQRLLTGTQDELRREAAEFFGRATGGLALVSMSRDYSAASRSVTPLAIREGLSFEGRRGADGVALRYLPPEIADWLAPPEVAGRRAPLRLDHPRTTRVVLDLRGVPRGAQLPGAWSHADRFVRLSRASRAIPSGLETVWTAETLRDEVPRGDLPGYARAMAEAYGDAELVIREPVAERPSPGPGMGAARAALLVVVALLMGAALGFLVGRRARARAR
jgi:hypothetical protein